ncbi:hypothetical protein [Marinomonas transparens]|uniref:hypothetical protein n=1 Tax=Marinomonas transparens TaxID=2795388 RepID=UPI001F1F892A|nr:hypothetical protein [Marinomonas transparens]
MVDPSVAQAFDAQSLRTISIPMRFINLGEPKTVPVSVASSVLSETVMNGRLDYVSEATHFSFLPECKASAKAFLKQIGETIYFVTRVVVGHERISMPNWPSL